MAHLSLRVRSLKRLLKATTVLGITSILGAGGILLDQSPAHAEAVRVAAVQQVPSFADVVEAVSPAVVSVRVKSTNAAQGDSDAFTFGGPGFDQLPDDHPMKRFFREFGENGHPGGKMPGPKGKGRPHPTSQGSGFFISEDGYVVTNNHVVDDGSTFTILMNDGTELDAKLIGKDKRTDLAVLKVDAKRKFAYVGFADDSKVRVGDWVVAVGNPFGLGGTVTAGIVSARGRDIGSGPYDDYLQVDAAVNRGNSGGPTFNLNGEVVGINTAIFSPSGGNVGIAFAIPSAIAKSVVSDLIKTGSVERGWLGVQIQPVNAGIAESLGLAQAQGALVVAPQADSPGEKAGIRKGDVVTAVDGEPIKGPKELAKRIGATRPGTVVELSVWRDGKAMMIKLTIGTLPEEKLASAIIGEPSAPAAKTEEALAGLGLNVAPSEDGKGVTIATVDPNSEAAEQGLKTGEKITSVNNQEVNTPADIAKLLGQAKTDGRKKALFQIENTTGSRFVALPIAEG